MWFTNDIKALNDACLDSLLKLARVSIDAEPPQRFSRSILGLLGDKAQGLKKTLPWRNLMPEREHRRFVKSIVSQLDEGLQRAPIDYFEGPWRAGNQLLAMLEGASIDERTYDDIVSSGTGNKWAVETFKPEHGVALATSYDRFGALTGRLTVQSGPSILTLKKEHRSMLRSSFEGGSIVSIDFNALEARVLLYEAGRRCDGDDLYGQLVQELGFDRKAIKAAVICELYGASKQSLGTALGIDGNELTTFIKAVKMHFNTDELLKRIKATFIARGEILNRYGRPVVVDEPMDHIMLNYYAQSSGVDVALMGFKIIMDRLRSDEKRNVRALYVLHDALIIDVPPERTDDVRSIRTVNVPGYVQRFCLKHEILTQR